MNLEQIQLVHEALAEGEMVEAANLALAADGIADRVKSKKEAFSLLHKLEQNLANENRYLEIAVFLWGNGMFDSRPSVVREVFHEVIANNRLLIMGASSLSKTFSAGVLFYLYWRTDPYWTAVKLAAPSEDHLYTNLFSHLVALHRASVLPMTDDDATKVKVNETDLFIAMHDALPEMRIQGILCKQSAVSSGSMRGHKPKTYRKPAHPKYGNSTRIYILIDEASQVSPGAFEDIKTTEMSINPESDNVKIVIPFNPEEVSDKVVQMAEPEEGWDIEQVDTLFHWTGKSGYRVLRLDAKRFENIVERRVVYPNMATYEAYLSLLKGGENSGAYWAKGRGFPPLKDNAWTIVPPAWMQSQRGEPIYIGKVRNIAVVDTALQGSDKAMMGVGRWGEAAGWRDMQGRTNWFVNRANPAERRTQYVCVLDQTFQLPKSNSTVEIVQEVMGRCKQMGIQADDCGFDKTGNAAGVWSHAKKFWGDVLGIDFGVKASEYKVISEDLQTAYDIYEGKVTELWFAMKRWMDPVVCALLVNPIVQTNPLFTQITTRRYRNVKGGRVRVEPKEEYKARNGMVSPDDADILCMMVEFCRQRGGVIPGMQEIKDGDRPDGSEVVSLESAEEDDPMHRPDWVSNRIPIDE